MVESRLERGGELLEKVEDGGGGRELFKDEVSGESVGYEVGGGGDQDSSENTGSGAAVLVAVSWCVCTCGDDGARLEGRLGREGAVGAVEQRRRQQRRAQEHAGGAAAVQVRREGRQGALLVPECLPRARVLISLRAFALALLLFALFAFALSAGAK